MGYSVTLGGLWVAIGIRFFLGKLWLLGILADFEDADGEGVLCLGPTAQKGRDLTENSTSGLKEKVQNPQVSSVRQAPDQFTKL